MKHFVIIAIFISRLMPSVASAQNATVLENTHIFSTAPFDACHASTIVETKSGKLIAAWFGGKHEGSNDVGIWISFKEKAGWSKPSRVADGKHSDGIQYPCWNPVLFQTRDDKLYLHYKVGKNPREWWAMYKVSGDDGKTWSVARRLPDNFLGPIKNKPLQLDNGMIIYGSSVETVNNNQWTVHVETSTAEHGQWRHVVIDCDTFGTIQPTIVQHPNGSLQMLARSKHNVVVQSWSNDHGATWSKIEVTNIPNPNSGIDAATLPDKLHLLVYNPLSAGKDWWMGRSVLRLAASSDGINWKDVLTFEDHVKGEYSYPAIIVGRDGLVHVTYTDNRKKIRYVKLRVE